MPVRSAYEIAATSTELGIVQEGYLYEGSEFPVDEGTQYLIHQVVPMDSGRAFILFDYDDPAINLQNRQAQVVRFDSSGYQPGPLLSIGTLQLRSSGMQVDGCYLGDGLVLIASTEFGSAFWFHLFRVADDDSITLAHSFSVAAAKFYWMLNIEALSTPGQAIFASGTGQTTSAHARFVKLAVVNDQVTLTSDVQQAGTYEPVTHPVLLSGDRLVYFGRSTSGSPRWILFDANTMTTITQFDPAPNGINVSLPVPAVAVDGDRVFVPTTGSGNLVNERCLLFDFAGNTFAFTELPNAEWPANFEKADPYGVSYWFDPSRPPELTQWKFMSGRELVGRVLDAETLVLMAPIVVNSSDDNELGIWHYKWQTSELTGFVLVKSAKKDDNPDSDNYLQWENLSWELPIADDGSALAVGSEYYDTDDPNNQGGFSGSIWLGLVGKPSSEIISGPRQIRRRFWQ